jgi:hypothetical protein
LLIYWAIASDRAGCAFDNQYSTINNDHESKIAESSMILKVSSSIGRASVSKTEGWGFESLLTCQTAGLRDQASGFSRNQAEAWALSFEAFESHV